MDNMNPQTGHRQVVDQIGLNSFLTKMYGNMALAVLVSALSSYLTLTTFRTAVMGYFVAHPGTVWLLLLLPIALSMGISFSATRNPVGGFIMLMVMAVIYGVEFALIAGIYTAANITTAFISAASVFIVLAIYGTVTKRSLDKAGSHSMAALIALIIASLVNLFLKSAVISYVFSYIAVIIFVVLTAWDAQKMKQLYIEYGNQVSVTGLAITGALQLYLDFINLFLQLLNILQMGSNRD
ncbi:MAG: Bax inhibitor-1/YccA family protein [[Lactobacillus] timonensis]|jgi:FtsH-binding integral membrane protein|uniref:Bax inhibitor-1/YccA family protein n=1 Tax=[Lactobacillus] timonensis TaxID=1970790 RepID=UPI0023530DAE|nr:Bax inhibitor-1/YccA family protein [[Lactobacillus] timonensis]MCI1925698.1 Bax inhibitor-1/YccA family protein [[Lactobacillus] timonensis]MCI1957059.1 Bax inhibitor-1/YccA family protein [[Lactobacillus] timonensis]MCI1969986.1 Bax inhibitor-1/YccA family protein [[Lactobacillus] timonensis]MCI2006249.1 Bax inhibitor-1/YccA family protein [[Lactobacillus] timonensis]